ncbi:hypothetical protein CEV31_0250 [Brucella thiophenivorans]|uniref:Uncharacterized protein n=1 Tax=Brucella thiophenivorans TaxID=571255 RepID=A0A256G6P7_9HYPH|nr:hypothetical protein CEV31_0250 [Brucella thiophenivorans]
MNMIQMGILLRLIIRWLLAIAHTGNGSAQKVDEKGTR